MPIIRHVVSEFVADWNMHPQRSNNKAVHVPGGRPNHLYLYDKSVPDFGRKPDNQLLQELLEDFSFVGKCIQCTRVYKLDLG